MTRALAYEEYEPTAEKSINALGTLSSTCARLEKKNWSTWVPTLMFHTISFFFGVRNLISLGDDYIGNTIGHVIV